MVIKIAEARLSIMELNQRFQKRMRISKQNHILTNHTVTARSKPHRNHRLAPNLAWIRLRCPSFSFLIGSWLPGSAPFRDLPIIIRRSHASGRDRWYMHCPINIHLHSIIPFTSNKAMHPDRPQNEVLKACCPISFHHSSHKCLVSTYRWLCVCMRGNLKSIYS